MNTLIRSRSLRLVLALALLLTMVFSLSTIALADDKDTEGVAGVGIGSSFSSKAEQVTARDMPIATDSTPGSIEIRVGLMYNNQITVNHFPFDFFTIEPVFDDKLLAVLDLKSANYTKYLKDITTILDKDGNYVEDYFSFPFGVKEDAVNGTYCLPFKVIFLSYYDDIEVDDPVSTTVNVYFTINNGKKPASTETPTEPTKNPSSAMLLLDSFVVEPEDIVAGDEFDVTFTLRNTTKRTISDVRGTVSNELGYMFPANGSSTLYIDRIPAGETADFTMRIKTTAQCGIEPAVLKLACDFVQNSLAYQSAESITIPVRQLANLVLDTPNYSNEIYDGDSINLTMNLFNKGKSALYNVTVALDCPGLKAEETYFAGTIEAGATKNYDVMVYTDGTASGQLQGNIVVTYEDSYGVSDTKTSPISVNVASMDDMGGQMGMYGDGMYVEDGMMVDGEMPMDAAPGMPMWAWFAIGGGVLVVAVVVVLLIVRKRKAAKKKELDDEVD